MKLQIMGGMANDKKTMEFVEWHPIDPVTGHILAYKEGVWAVPGGGTADEPSIRKWASERGYTVKARP